MDYEEILAAYQRALAAGHSREALDADLRQSYGLTFRQLTGRAAMGRPLGEAVRQTPEEREAESRNYRLRRHGFSMNLSDELKGGAAALGALVPGGRSPGEAYRETRDAHRAQIDRDRVDAGPMGAMVQEGIGGLLLPGLGGARVGGAVLNSGGRFAGSRLAAGAAGGAAAGAGGGALAGVGEGETFGDRLAGGAGGAIVGGPLGFLLGGAGAVGGRIFGRARARPTARATDVANREVRQGLAAARLSPDAPGATRGNPIKLDTVQVALQRLGPDAVVADASPNLGRMARTARNNAPSLDANDGPVDRIIGRNEESRERVAEGLREAAGIRTSFDDSVRAAEDNLERISAEVYGPLESAHPQINHPAINALLGDPEVARIAARIGIKPGETPTFRQLQDLNSLLADEVEGAVSASGRTLVGQQRLAKRRQSAFVDAMDEAAPGFRDAQRMWMEGKARVGAHDLGRRAASRPAHQIRKEMETLPESAREAYRVGLLDTMEERLLGTEGGAPRWATHAGRKMQDRLRIVADSDPRAFRRLMDRLGIERAQGKTAHALSGNSTTEMQQQDSDAMLRDLPTTKEGLLRSLLGPNPADRERAAELVGEYLLSDPEAALEMWRTQLQMAPSVAGGLGGILGSVAGREAVKPVYGP